MAIVVGIRGLEEVIAKAERAIARTRTGADRGLVAAAALVKEESQKRTPVDKGVLRASHYVGGVTGSGKNRKIEVGAGANYALFVHENKRRAVFNTGQEKFLERAYFDNEDKVVNLVVQGAREG